MKVEIFPSASGDCLLVTSNDGKRLLADAGLPAAYENFIAPPLSKLRKAGDAIDVAYVSHIDRDHIGGILRLLDHEVAWRAFDHSEANGGRLRKPKAPRPPEVLEIWHNAFLEDIQRTEAIDLGSALAATANVLAGLNAALVGGVQASALAAEAQMLALSVGDAIEVNWRISTDQLGIPLNPAFNGELMTARSDQQIQLGSMSVSVLGPTSKQLRELRKKWIDWLHNSAGTLDRLREKHSDAASELASGASPQALAQFSRELALSVEKDVTPPNLASLVLLVTDNDGSRILLTGDAGNDSMVDYFEAANLFDDTGRLDVDVLKVPHHGAHNSYSDDFAQRIRARHLIFCGDGEHDNPEPDVVAGYIEAVKAAPLPNGEKTTFWFNWSLARAVHFQPHWSKVEALFDRSGVSAFAKRRSLRKTEKSMVLTL